MGGRFFLVTLKSGRSEHPGLFLCGLMFLGGSVAGTMSAAALSDGASLSGAVAPYLSVFIEGARARPDLAASLFNAYKYHLASVFLGFSLLGVVLIPALSAVRGFFLSFSIAVVVRMYGAKGILLALSVFGISAVITIPCFFVLSIAAFSASSALCSNIRAKGARAAAQPLGGRLIQACVVCMALLFLAAVIDAYLTPHLIGLAASRLTT